MISALLSDPRLQGAVALLAALSLATFVISLLLIPLVVARLPGDCFLRLHSGARTRTRRGPVRLVLLAIRNLFGALLVVAGVVMLFLPGQGLLTILLGTLLLSIPGKRRLVLALTASPRSRHGLDWLRRKTGKPPFLWPDEGRSREV